MAANFTSWRIASLCFVRISKPGRCVGLGGVIAMIVEKVGAFEFEVIAICSLK
jgi:hypothetical protein